MRYAVTSKKDGNGGTGGGAGGVEMRVCGSELGSESRKVDDGSVGSGGTGVGVDAGRVINADALERTFRSIRAAVVVRGMGRTAATCITDIGSGFGTNAIVDEECEPDCGIRLSAESASEVVCACDCVGDECEGEIGDGDRYAWGRDGT